VTEFPVREGTIRQPRAISVAFEVTVDGYAQPAPSSRGALAFAAPRDGGGIQLRHRARHLGRCSALHCPDLRDGYLRADPSDPLRAHGGVEGARPRRSFDKPATSPSARTSAPIRAPASSLRLSIAESPHDHVAESASALMKDTRSAAAFLPPADTAWRGLDDVAARTASGRAAYDDNMPAADRGRSATLRNVLPLAVNE